MSVMTAPAATGARVQAVPWRKLAWVGWRQHRLALGGVAALLAGLFLWMLVSGLQMRSRCPASG